MKPKQVKSLESQLNKESIVYHNRLKSSTNNVKYQVFIHIPKTAGTALRQMLVNEKTNMLPTIKQLNKNNGNYPNFSTIVESLASTHTGSLSLIFGHYPYSCYSDLSHLDLRYSTVLRAPIERSLSNLIHLKTYNKRCRKMQLDEIIKFAPYQVENSMVRYLCTDNVHPLHKVNEDHLEQALLNLNTFQTIGLQEHYESFCSNYFNHIGLPFHNDLSKNIINRRKEKQLIPNEESIRDTLRSMNALDLILYKEIESQMK